MNIYDEIAAANECLQGWCSRQKAITLASMVCAVRPPISMEIGVFGGKGIFPMAMMHQHLKFGKSIGIDPWKASESVKGQVNKQDEEWWARQEMHDAIYNEFMGIREKTHIEPYMEIHRITSDEYVPTQDIGILSIDGNHGNQVLMDVERYCPLVPVGGFVVMDDLNWSGGAVSKAAQKLTSLRFRELYRVQNDQECWAVFQRII